MNEGHAALLALELMDRYQLDLEWVKSLCVFTTHTPVPAGHDTFPVELVTEVLGDFRNPDTLRHDNIIGEDDRLNMTYLALFHAEYINGVAQKHGETSQEMFPEYRIDAITNGVHARTWISDAMASVLDRHMPNWRNDPYALRNALNIPRDDIWQAHMTSKKDLFNVIAQQTRVSLDPETLTIGFARRAATYKRATLLLSQPDRLRRIASTAGDMQIVYAGKAHPADEAGRALIRQIHQTAQQMGKSVRIHLFTLQADRDIVHGKKIQGAPSLHVIDLGFRMVVSRKLASSRAASTRLAFRLF